MLCLTKCCTSSVLFWGGKWETRKTIEIHVRHTIRRCVDDTSDHQNLEIPDSLWVNWIFVENQPFQNYEPCCGPAKTIPRNVTVSTSILGSYDRRFRKDTWLSDRTNVRTRSFLSRLILYSYRLNEIRPIRSVAFVTVSDNPCFSRKAKYFSSRVTRSFLSRFPLSSRKNLKNGWTWNFWETLSVRRGVTIILCIENVRIL